ncbi:MAG: GNAT family N-acetyltransferase [Deltaproteobacteria bacterium]|nr:GNAT family N-acetyltransferase [Deltaproteobacteria bacterium]
MIRLLTPKDGELLRGYLYLALYVPEGQEPFPLDVLQEPAVARFVVGWGRDGDLGVLASDSTGSDIGSAWLRRWAGSHRGYGFVANDIPELSMAVRPAHRGRGVGTVMLQALLGNTDERGWSVSLSVHRKNPVIRLYQRCGFREHEEHGDSVTMLRRPPEKDARGGRTRCRS